MKYQLSVSVANFNLKHAGNKAVNDCERILKDRGYENIHMVFNKSVYLIVLSLARLMMQLLILSVSIKPNSLIIIQYPLAGINSIFKMFIKLLRVKKCVFCCVVHDINSLRYQFLDWKVKQEVDYLNAYDLIISHNEKMAGWMKNKGVKAEILPLGIFDYLYINENSFDPSLSYLKDITEVIYAGNLTRGKFIYDLYHVKKIKFSLYGPVLDQNAIKTQANVVWKGEYQPEELVQKLQGHFGLIWDGDSITNCEGPYGDYIEYNNPHKVSLYIAAGIPVIISAKAAMSSFIISENIGITVSDLNNLFTEISKVNHHEYLTMVNNIKHLRKKLKEGYYFNSALQKVEERSLAYR